jgi:UDP-3-O-[3-hydroxymyristoyl] glucosamine N-acyltransferase
MKLGDLRVYLLADARLVGDENVEVRGLRAFDGMFGSNEMTYITASRASVESLRTHPATTFITDLAVEGVPPGKSFIHTSRPRLQMAKLSHLFAEPTQDFEEPTKDVRIAASAKVHPRAFVSSNVTIGDDTVVHANVTIYRKAVIGKRCIIHSGTVIGAEGFGYEKDDDGTWFRIAHLGGVVIGDDVEIGANTCVDRGTLGDTIIESGAKVDNLVHVAHNVRIGKHAMVIANAMLGGSSVIGEGAWIAPSATIREGRRIGDRAVVGLGSVVVRDVEPGVTVMGVPAKPREK